MNRLSDVLLVALSVEMVAACHAVDDPKAASIGHGQGSPGAAEGTGAGGADNTGPSSGSMWTTVASSGGGFDGPVPIPLNPDADPGYQLGAALGPGAAAATGARDASGHCALVVGVVRDFQPASVVPGGHPDFEAFIVGPVTPNLVATTLGRDRKPVYASQCEASLAGGTSGCPSGQQTTTQANYDAWYRPADGINQAFLVYLEFAPDNTNYRFTSGHYFPLDGKGFGNSANGDDGSSHNYEFTTELHITFLYGGGETLTLMGDDDAWIFVNGKLAVDLGGVHRTLGGAIDFDQSAARLGLTTGSTYSLDIFKAERHTTASTFQIETDLNFTTCGEVIPEP